MEKLSVSLVTPGRQVARVEVDMVVAPSVMGEIGVLADHRPLLADLAAGQVILKAGNRAEVYAVSDGFLEVQENHVTILAETAEHTSEVDVDRALAALKDAQVQQKKLEAGTPEHQEQVAREKRARARLAVVGKEPK